MNAKARRRTISQKLFKDFEALHQQMRQIHKSLPEIPDKSAFGTMEKNTFVIDQKGREEGRKLLEKYLANLMLISEVRQSEEFQYWLDNTMQVWVGGRVTAPTEPTTTTTTTTATTATTATAPDATTPATESEKEKKDEEEYFLCNSDYSGEADGSLVLQTGDVLRVIKKHKDGWWFCSLKEKEGLVPSSILSPTPAPAWQVLTVPLRELICCGFLQKKSSGIMGLQRRWCLLNAAGFSYGKSDKVITTQIPISQIVGVSHNIPDARANTSLALAFELDTGQKKMIFLPDTGKDRQMWLAGFESAFRLKEGNQSKSAAKDPVLHLGSLGTVRSRFHSEKKPKAEDVVAPAAARQSLGTGAKITQVVKILYDYTSDSGAHLSAGEAVMLLEQGEDGWCLGQRGSEAFWFPASFADIRK
eukprot:TRINITY_DN2304_c0_g1_i1.p1 TRINITY_DN2304_c0_g1~~TRINITY_DN2304_c0_g1_i1.p1  ORF type:complete len:417 (-),score=104.69 TRINITY_DN2304_c0_g1_i1:54-1304(-)